MSAGESPGHRYSLELEHTRPLHAAHAEHETVTQKRPFTNERLQFTWMYVTLATYLFSIRFTSSREGSSGVTIKHLC